MADRIKFHLDEHMDPDIAAALRRSGIEVVTSAELGLLGEPDEAHLERARIAGRVIVTDDVDFLRLARTGTDHAGIVF